ncbi:MAG TPA: FtsQ-type POTRA domain-containing protein, partial [Hyphomicrobiaceae bacterium]|nr:FtsQ-type POTRA domain-containing protein [Hyphomicrobiaceae bacterium]
MPVRGDAASAGAPDGVSGRAPVSQRPAAQQVPVRHGSVRHGIPHHGSGHHGPFGDGRPNKRRSRRRNRVRHLLTRFLPMGAAVFGGFCFLLLTDGGRLVRRADPLVMQLDRVAERLGLGIDQASVSGHRMTSSSDIFKALNLKEVRSLVRFDSAEARRRIEALPWIEKAQVLSVLPNRL